MSLPAAAMCHAFATSFLISSEIALTSYPVISRLVPMLSASLSEYARLHTMNSWSDGVVNTMLITHVCSASMFRVICVKLMIEVISRYVVCVVFAGSLFSMRWYVSTSLSSPAMSLLSPQCTFYSGLWELKSSRRFTLPLMMLLQSVSISAFLLLLHRASIHTWSD